MKPLTRNRVTFLSMVAGVLLTPWIWVAAQQRAGGPVAIDADDIGGDGHGGQRPQSGGLGNPRADAPPPKIFPDGWTQRQSPLPPPPPATRGQPGGGGG